ncbi:unnamed protein product [Hydatigera taeniaeformis]|uniref:Expressed conserved protein n=1 Tax=Hydatigena taeniaeformis TaxID=6205 RepID=A0A0R3WYM9_HYDTA|nr:unnamed protein product [Hydatigera taeniaeformis]
MFVTVCCFHFFYGPSVLQVPVTEVVCWASCRHRHIVHLSHLSEPSSSRLLPPVLPPLPTSSSSNLNSQLLLESKPFTPINSMEYIAKHIHHPPPTISIPFPLQPYTSLPYPLYVPCYAHPDLRGDVGTLDRQQRLLQRLVDDDGVSGSSGGADNGKGKKVDGAELECCLLDDLSSNTSQWS